MIAPADQTPMLAWSLTGQLKYIFATHSRSRAQQRAPFLAFHDLLTEANDHALSPGQVREPMRSGKVTTGQTIPPLSCIT